MNSILIIIIMEFINMNLYKIILYPTILLVFAFSYACQINHEDPGPGTIFLENAGNEKVFFEDLFELVDSFSFDYGIFSIGNLYILTELLNPQEYLYIT